MQTDDIDKLAGPELSAAVAREVMGWTESSEIDHKNRKWWLTADGDNMRSLDTWHPQNDRNDAHRVLKRCEELGIAPQAYTWIYLAAKRRRPRRIGLALLTIDPTIICRAALRAVRASK